MNILDFSENITRKDCGGQIDDAVQLFEISGVFPAGIFALLALSHRARKYLLLAASYYFYMCWKPEFIVLILYSTAVDYLCALGMERRAEHKKLFLAVSLTMNLGLLFFFKYFNFFGATLTALCRAVSIPFPAPVLSIILPVGISFYTFQTLSYTIDVYRGRMKAERDFWRRWHISLTGWFREYVYIPLGGNRRGRGRTALLKLVTFLLSGLWHGAGWTFVVWGGFNGCYLVLESLLPHSGVDKARMGRGGFADAQDLCTGVLCVGVFPRGYNDRHRYAAARCGNGPGRTGALVVTIIISRLSCLDLLQTALCTNNYLHFQGEESVRR